jgi:predicted NUDIX family phosphoesterase
MTDKSAERILVIPTEEFHQLGVFQGFRGDVATYLPRLLDPAKLWFLPRRVAEHDPSFKQLIPYVVLRWRDELFHYSRGAGGTETRLQALRSIGVGGHISDEDVTDGGDPYRTGLMRELAEEVDVQCPYTERVIGLINDDTTPVGQVHLGVVHLLELAEPKVRHREETVAASGFAPLAELRRDRVAFETWSQLLLDELT